MIKLFGQLLNIIFLKLSWKKKALLMLKYQKFQIVLELLEDLLVRVGVKRALVGG